MERISLTWPRDPTGYHVEMPNKQLAARVPRFSKMGPDIVSNGGKLRGEQLRFIHEPIWKNLAKCEDSTDGALAFVNRFGFLRSKGRRESVSSILKDMHTVRWLHATAKDEDWDTIGQWLLDDSRKVVVKVGVNVVMGAAKDGRPELQYQPRNLIGAIYLQLLQDETGGAQYKRCLCPGCPKYFYYGPNTGRRSRAKYCTPACRVKHFTERKQKEQSK